MAIQLNPEHAQLYFNRGTVYDKMDEFNSAIGDYTKAIQLKPDAVESYVNRGIDHGLKGEADLAIENLNKAIQLKPDTVKAYINLGNVYLLKDDVDSAISNYSTAIELESDYAYAYHNRGFAYFLKGEVNHALADYEKVLELEPNYAQVYYNRVIALLYQQEWRRAREALAVASNRGVDIIASFLNDYQGVRNFENKVRVKLPEDIATMLTESKKQVKQTQPPPRMRNLFQPQSRIESSSFGDSTVVLQQVDQFAFPSTLINQFQG